MFGVIFWTKSNLYISIYKYRKILKQILKITEEENELYQAIQATQLVTPSRGKKKATTFQPVALATPNNNNEKILNNGE